MFDFYVSARCPLLYSIATLGCRVFCCEDYYVSVICLEFGLFGYVSARCCMLRFIATLVRAICFTVRLLR